jgi:hypothetical protein
MQKAGQGSHAPEKLKRPSPFAGRGLPGAGKMRKPSIRLGQAKPDELP